MLQELYQDLLEYDKRPLVFRLSDPAWGRLDAPREVATSVHVDNMKQ